MPRAAAAMPRVLELVCARYNFNCTTCLQIVDSLTLRCIRTTVHKHSFTAPSSSVNQRVIVLKCYSYFWVCGFLLISNFGATSGTKLSTRVLI